MRLFVFILILIIQKISFGQTAIKLEKEIGFGLMTSTLGENPFWARSNTWGTIPLASNGSFVFAGVHKDYDSTYTMAKKLRRTDWGFGASTFMHVNLKSSAGFKLPELYIKGRWRALELHAGRFKQIHGIGDETLSSGAFIWSDNALPIPKIQIAIPNYVSILGHGLISLKGNFAHGWFGKQPYTINYYLHQKMLYGKLGKDRWPVTLEAGLNNQIQWGGYSEILKDNPGSTKDGYMPDNFNTFISTILPIPAIQKRFPAEFNLQGDDLNYGGNVLGTVDFGLNIRLKNTKVKIYRQLPYETGSLFTSLVNADDGIYGLSLHLPKTSHRLTHVVIEGLHTYNQGAYRAGIARLLDLKDRHFGELHNYLNHFQYLEGWSNKEKSLGTPFLMPDAEVKNRPRNIYTLSSFNQVNGLYVGIEGKNERSKYQVRTSFMNYRKTGGPYIPNNTEISQISFSAKYDYMLKPDTFIITQLAYDNAGFLKKNVGLILTFRKLWY